MQTDETKNDSQPLPLGAVSGSFEKANSISGKIRCTLLMRCKRDEIIPMYCELINESAKLSRTFRCSF
jgi:hypothetical protein